VVLFDRAGCADCSWTNRRLESLYSSKPPTHTVLSSACINLFSTLTGLTTLELFFPASENVTSLLSAHENDLPLVNLVSLRSFTLRGGFIWFNDLLSLLAAWKSSETLDVAFVRGDCNSFSPFATNPPLPCKLHKLAIHSSTLTDAMVTHLLADQTSLKELKIALPGTGGKAWTAIGKVMPNIEVLRLRDSWASTSRQKATKKAESEAPEHGEAQDVSPSTPSPLLPLLKAAKSLETVLLTPAMLPSLPETNASFDSLLPYLAVVDIFELDGFPLTSPLFPALAAALDKHRLPSLERVVTKGVTKGRKGPGAKTEKAFEQACKKHWVEWVTATDE
jgi:hypothetical protein